MASSRRRLGALSAQLSPPWVLQRAPAAHTAATPAVPQKLRLAFVGCGSICHAHLNGLNALAADRIRVTVCIDTSEERANELAGIIAATAAGGGSRPATFSSLADALASGEALFDAVDIMLPHHLHRPITLQALGGP